MASAAINTRRARTNTPRLNVSAGVLVILRKTVQLLVVGLFNVWDNPNRAWRDKKSQEISNPLLYLSYD